MEEAIKLAIIGGFMPEIKNRPLCLEQVLSGCQDDIRYKFGLVLNPLFWQALGRVLGWGENFGQPPWKIAAIRFFELRLTGGDEEKFWKELLNN